MRASHALRVRAAALAVVLGGLAAGGLAAPTAAHAHVPLLEPNRSSDTSGGAERPFPAAVPIEPPEASTAVYGYLAPDEEFDVFSFVPEHPIETNANVLVSAEDGGAAFRPSATILSVAPDGPRELASAGSPAERETFFEPFTFETLYEGPPTRVRLEAGRRYYVKVEPGPGERRGGAYVVSFGGPETFSFGEGTRTFVYVPMIVLGLYGQAPFDPWPLVAMVGAAGAILGAAAFVRWKWRKRLD